MSFSPNGACTDRPIVPIPRSSEPHNRQQYIATRLDFDDTISEDTRPTQPQINVSTPGPSSIIQTPTEQVVQSPLTQDDATYVKLRVPVTPGNPQDARSPVSKSKVHSPSRSIDLFNMLQAQLVKVVQDVDAAQAEIYQEIDKLKEKHSPRTVALETSSVQVEVHRALEQDLQQTKEELRIHVSKARAMEDKLQTTIGSLDHEIKLERKQRQTAEDTVDRLLARMNHLSEEVMNKQFTSHAMRNPPVSVSTSTSVQGSNEGINNHENRKSSSVLCDHVKPYYLVQGPHDPLSNFKECKLEVLVDGKRYLYNSLEQGFQHQKARVLKDQSTAIRIMNTRSAAAAKSEGDSLNTHPNIVEWRKREDAAMMSLFEAKYKASRLFREKLAATGQAQLLHSVTDAHWGIGINSTDIRHPIQSFNGMNNMCKLLMQFRDIVMNRSNTQTVSVDQSLSTGEPIKVPSTKVAHIIGNSLIKGIDENKLYHGITSHRLFAPTIDKAMELIPDESDIVVYQLGTNDAKDSDFEKLISDMQTLVEATRVKLDSARIALSLSPTQRGHNEVNAKLKALNAFLELKYRGTNVIIIPNENITLDCISDDGVHLTRQGSSLLANNIRQVLRDTLRMEPIHQGHSRSNYQGRPQPYSDRGDYQGRPQPYSDRGDYQGRPQPYIDRGDYQGRPQPYSDRGDYQGRPQPYSDRGDYRRPNRFQNNNFRR